MLAVSVMLFFSMLAYSLREQYAFDHPDASVVETAAQVLILRLFTHVHRARTTRPCVPHAPCVRAHWS